MIVFPRASKFVLPTCNADEETRIAAVLARAAVVWNRFEGEEVAISTAAVFGRGMLARKLVSHGLLERQSLALALIGVALGAMLGGLLGFMGRLGAVRGVDSFFCNGRRGKGV